MGIPNTNPTDRKARAQSRAARDRCLLLSVELLSDYLLNVVVEMEGDRQQCLDVAPRVLESCHFPYL